MFIRVLSHELRSFFRDKMYTFLMIYPIMMAVVAYFLMPYLREQANMIASNIVTVVFILLNSFMFGAIIGFSLLDDQDDQVLLSLKIAPINVRYYVLIKLLISYILGVIATILIILAGRFYDALSFKDLLFITILTPFQGPIFALLINAFANNKVEGFVIMKMSGIILLVPIAALFLTNATEILIYFLPGFWTARIVSFSLLPVDFLLPSTFIYFFLGLIVNGLVGLFFYKLYIRRVNI
ncbi:MAG: hypothetical protein CVV61_04685 [Tenericutes bacterium HGW-Tenericutes-6]|nr:MAG: hypothetical protein CVV61_04685 [Tenericutes bacterium HGW-Tenericutes-6]